MTRIYDYHRKITYRRDPNRIIDLGEAGVFPAVLRHNPEPIETFDVDGNVFTSLHTIDSPAGSKVFTALRSEQEPSILLIIWRGFPFYQQIEDGGDLMLQEIQEAPELRHLIIDNTFVHSGWMNDQKMVEYLNTGWIPGLVRLGLRGFCHLQAASYIGGQSFRKFGELASKSITEIAVRLGREPFRYFPVRTSEISSEGNIDSELRLRAFRDAFSLLRSL
ncbi:MAG: hypothetical protein JXA20_07255 [Spirochaetes bacterium]|nr:hypothetical protein [Spirochaetota bacterium]